MVPPHTRNAPLFFFCLSPSPQGLPAGFVALLADSKAHPAWSEALPALQPPQRLPWLAQRASQLDPRPSQLALRPSQLAIRLTQLDLRPSQYCSFLKGSLGGAPNRIQGPPSQAIAGSRRSPTGGRDPINYWISGSVASPTNRPSVFLSLFLENITFLKSQKYI